MRTALAAVHADEERTEAEQTRAADLDQQRVTRFVEAANVAADGLRVLRDVLKALDRWTLVTSPVWSERHVTHWTDKRFYIDAPSYVGQENIAKQMGRRAGLQEMTDLVALFGDVEARAYGADVREAVEAAITELRAEGLAPSLVIFPVDARLLIDLGLKLRSDPEGMAGTIAPQGHADKFNGVIDGVAVLDHPGLKDRVLVLDLAAAVRMEERPTRGDTGVYPTVRSFDPAAARRLLAEQPHLVDPEVDEEENVGRVQGRVLLDVAVAWKVIAGSACAVRAVELPSALDDG